MISAIKACIRKVKSALFRKKIDALILQEICKTANPTFSSYVDFLAEHSPHINRSDFISQFKKLYTQYPSDAYEEMRDYVEEYDNAEVVKLFEDTFRRYIPNATLLVMKHGLEDNIIFDEILRVTIKNLDIRGNTSLEFNQFSHVFFVNNIFRDIVIIKITNLFFVKGQFLKNHAKKNLEIVFHKALYIISKKNKYMAKMILNYNPRAFGLDHNPSPPLQTSIVFINDEILNLNINDHIKEEKLDRKLMPIKYISFFGGNKVKKLDIQTASNKIYNESPDIPLAHIDTIFFDTRENIGMSYEAGSPFLAFAEMFFRDLKKQAIEKEDRLLETTYHRQEKIFLQTRLFRLEDKFISWWSTFSSDTGISWKRPLGWLLLFQLILALTAYCLFAEYDPYLGEICTPELKECNPYLDKGLIPFLGLFAWFMNPVSLLPPVAITMASGLIYVLFLFQKLFAAVFYYEIIKVLRRFSR